LVSQVEPDLSVIVPVYDRVLAISLLLLGAVMALALIERIAWGSLGAGISLIPRVVAATEAAGPEVLAKAAFLAGPSAAGELLSATGTDGLLVTDDGEVWTTEGFRRFARPEPAGVRTAHPATLEGSFR